MVPGVNHSLRQAPDVSSIKVEPLGPQHDRAVFVCSKEHLTYYFNGPSYPPRTLDQDIKYNTADPFVMVNTTTNEVLGYFTLSIGSIPGEQLPKNQSKKLYPDVSTMLIGRMAIHRDLERQGFGTRLLLSALYQAYLWTHGGRSCYAVMVDAEDNELLKWYQKRGFVHLATSNYPRRLFYPMKAIIDNYIPKS